MPELFLGDREWGRGAPCRIAYVAVGVGVVSEREASFSGDSKMLLSSLIEQRYFAVCETELAASVSDLYAIQSNGADSKPIRLPKIGGCRVP